MIVVILLAFAAMLVLNLPSLIKNRDFKLIAVYCLFYAASLLFSLLLAFNVKVPSPIIFVDNLFKAIRLSH